MLHIKSFETFKYKSIAIIVLVELEVLELLKGFFDPLKSRIENILSWYAFAIPLWERNATDIIFRQVFLAFKIFGEGRNRILRVKIWLTLSFLALSKEATEFEGLGMQILSGVEIVYFLEELFQMLLSFRVNIIIENVSFGTPEIANSCFICCCNFGFALWIQAVGGILFWGLGEVRLLLLLLDSFIFHPYFRMLTA